MQNSTGSFQARSPETLTEAQQSALEMASRLGTLAFNYAMELNKTWFELAQNSMKQYASFPSRLAQCRTPEEVFSAQADLINRASNEYKEGLSTHASMIEKATQDYKEGLDQLASFGEKMARETGKAMQQGQEFAQEAARRTTRPEEGQQARGRGRGERQEGDKDEQAQRAH